MRARVVLVLSMLTGLVPLHASEPPKLAVFDFEMIDTSLPGQFYGPQAAEHDRLMRVGEQLRKELGESGKFQIVDIAPVNAAAHQSNLQACGGCDVKLARELNADLDITGTVQKVSNLILNINVYLADVGARKLVFARSVDIRGNTDESWSRGMTYLLKNYLLKDGP